jgi:hypothetical protein
MAFVVGAASSVEDRRVAIGTKSVIGTSGG